MSKAEKDDKNDVPEEGARSFGVFLAKVREGSLEAELSEKLHDLLGALTSRADVMSKAKGRLTLTLDFLATRAGTVTVLSDVKVKEPPEDKTESVFWVSPGGNLIGHNPKQERLPLREVEKRADPAREVPSAKAAPRSV